MTQQGKSSSEPVWDRPTPASAVNKADRDRLFDDIQRVIDEFVPEDPERVELQPNNGAVVQTRGEDAAAAYIGSAVVKGGRSVDHPTAKVRVGDPSRMAVTERNLRPPPPPAPQVVDVLPTVPKTPIFWPLAIGSLLLVAAGIVFWLMQSSTETPDGVVTPPPASVAPPVLPSAPEPVASVTPAPAPSADVDPTAIPTASSIVPAPVRPPSTPKTAPSATPSAPPARPSNAPPPRFSEQESDE